jgi:hypothetical protein
MDISIEGEGMQWTTAALQMGRDPSLEAQLPLRRF